VIDSTRVKSKSTDYKVQDYKIHDYFLIIVVIQHAKKGKLA